MSSAVALVGTGDWARSGLGPSLSAQPDVMVVACAGPDREQAAGLAHDLGIARVYSELDEMLAAETELDLLVISTPDDHHPVAVRRAVAAGLAIFCEKPLANSAGDADELADAVEAAGLTATVGYSFRYSTAIQQLRNDLRAGRLGTPWLLEMHEHNPQFHAEVGRALNWKGDPAHAAGGAIYEYGAHLVDLGSWLLGPVASVTSQFAAVTPNARLDDIASVQLRFESGVLGTLVASWVLSGGTPGIRVRLHGSAGCGEASIGATADGGETYVRLHASGELIERLDLTPPSANKSTYTSRHIADLLATMKGRPPVYADTLPTMRSAAHTQRVLVTALNATERRLPVGAGRPEGRI